MSWPVHLLGTLIKSDGGVLQTGPFGSQLKQAEYASDGVPVIMPTDIENGEVNERTVARVPETTVERLRRHKIRAGGIVLPRRGTITKRAFIRSDQDGWLCGTGCIKIEVNGHCIWPRYLYYYLGLKDSVEWLERNAVGSTMLNLSTEIVSRFPMVCPSIPTQRRIADILSAYDELIENNRRRIALLEQAAQELYREWFVRLRFPGHESTRIVDGAPEGWERKTYADSFSFLGGFAFKSKTYEQDGEYEIVTIKNVHDAQFIPECPSKLNYVPEKMKEHCALATGDILLSLTGNVGRACVVFGRNYLLNQRVAKVVGSTDIPKSYTYWTFSNKITQKELENLAHGVAQLNLSPVILGQRSLLKPSSSLLRSFEQIADPILWQITMLNLKIVQLRQARDVLLPRLMSGEVAV